MEKVAVVVSADAKLVDPHKTSGQNLFRQYAGKKTKLVLSYRWIRECISANQLQTFSTNWAGCKVTGEEQYVSQLFSRVVDPQPSITEFMPNLPDFRRTIRHILR
jgi:hypothetical protein